MKYLQALVLTCLAALTASAASGAPLRIVTTTPDFADLARQVGGDKVEVHSVMKGPENVHNVVAKPTEMLKLNKAALFVHGGLDAEPWRDGLLKGARNPRVTPGKPGDVDMSRGIELKDAPEGGRVDRSQGDVHAYGNPHYSTDPRNGMRMTATLARAMAEVDPANADLYRANAKRVVNELADLHGALKGQLAPYRGLKVVTYHKSWDYFADAFGLEVVAVIEAKVSVTPSPADVRRVIETARAAGAKVVIVETYNSYEQAKFVADAVGARVVVLPDHVNGVKEADSYQNLFRYGVGKLVEAVAAAGVEPHAEPRRPATGEGGGDVR